MRIPSKGDVRVNLSKSGYLSQDYINLETDQRIPKIIRFDRSGKLQVPSSPSVTPPNPNVSPSPSVDRTVQSTWQFVGTASTGESIFVDSSSIKKSADAIDFTYRIGGEVLVARADCGGDRWYVNKYDKWYSPSSQATQDMLSYVCR